MAKKDKHLKAKAQKAKRLVAKPKKSVFNLSIYSNKDAGQHADLFKKMFWIAFGIFSIILIAMAVNAGINEDEKFHYAYQDMLMDFYTTLGKDKAALNVEKGKMHLYGGMVDILSATTNKIVGNTKLDPGFHKIRHLIIGLFGCLGLLFTGLLGKRLTTWLGGLITLILIFLSPRFLGHAAVNPRDLPFAAGYIMAIYFLVKFLQTSDNWSWKTLLGIIGGLGIAMGVRSGGLLLFAYLWLFISTHFVFRQLFNDKIKPDLMNYLKFGGMATVGGYFLGILFWPFGLVSPLENAFVSLKSYSNFATTLRMLFDGDMLWSNTIPTFSYITTWLGMTLTLLVIVGVVLALIFSRSIVKRSNYFYTGLVAFTVLFPFCYILYKGSNLYSGLRHLLFFTPVIVTIAGLGWEFVLSKWMNEKKYFYPIVAAFSLLSLGPISHYVQNFNTTYVYFNEVSGGVKGALGHYELDYWGVSIKPAVEWLSDEGIVDLNTTEKISIASNYYTTLRAYTYDQNKNIKVPYVKYRNRFDKDYDFAIFVNNFIDGTQLRSENWPSGRVLKTIGKNGVPFSLIYDNRDKTAMNAMAALKGKRFEEARKLFEQEITKYPNNDIAHSGLGQCLMQLNQGPAALAAFKKALELNPGDQLAATYTGIIQMNLGDLAAAKNTFLEGLKYNKQNPNMYYYLAQVNFQQGKIIDAESAILEALKYNPRFKQAYGLGAQIYDKLGNTSRANQFRAAAK